MAINTSPLRSLTKPFFILPAVCLLALYLFTRLYNLTLIPVFVDEAIYIRWSQVMRAEPSLRFLPLSDGKQPLFMWLTMPALKFLTDPLFAGRLVSGVAGLFTLLGLVSLVYYLTRSRLAILLVGFLYTITPYTLFFDRFALADSLLSTFGVWSLFLGLLLIHRPRLDLSLFLGFSLGGALLTKTPGLFFVLLQPVLLLTLPDFSRRRLLKILGGWVVAGLLALVIYNILRLGPNFHMIGARNQDYVFSLAEVLKRPLDPLLPNLNRAQQWFLSLLTPSLAFTAILALSIKKYRRLSLALLLWSLLPLVYQSAVAKVYTTRYLLYTVPPLLTLSTLFLTHLRTRLKRHLFVVVLAFVFILPLIKSFELLTDPTNARIPEESRRGYFQEWTAGYGQKEVAQFLINRAQISQVFVGTEGYFGTLPDGLQIYTDGTPYLTVVGVGQPIYALPDSLNNSLIDNEVYLVANRSRLHLTPIELTRLEPIATYPKPPRPDGTQEVLELYRLHEHPVR